MALREFTGSGNTSNAANWAGGIKPGPGDMVRFYSGPVVIDADLHCGTNPATGSTDHAISNDQNCLSITLNPGVRVTCDGNWWNPRPDVPTTIGAGAIVEFSGAGNYYFNFYDTLRINGTQASPVVFRTIGAGSGRAQMLQDAWPCDIIIDRLTLDNMGSATFPAIRFRSEDEATNDRVVYRHIVTNANCGGVYFRAGKPTSDFVMEDCTFGGLLGAADWPNTTTYIDSRPGPFTTEERRLERCDFHVPVSLGDLGNFVFKHNIFRGHFWQWSSFFFKDGMHGFNVFRETINREVNVGFHVKDAYLIEDNASTNPHFLSCNHSGPEGSIIDGCIFHFTGDVPDGDYVLTGPSNGGAPVPWIIRNCIGLPNGVGQASGSLTFHGQPGDVVIIEHNTFTVGGSPGANVGEAYAGHAGMISVFRNNLGFMNVAVPGGQNYLLNQLEQTPDVVTPAGCTHNCAGPGMLAGSNGKGYHNVPLSSGSLGANDLPFGTDPQLVDPSRNLLTWDASLGGAGTSESALDRLGTDPTLIETALFPYVRGGFAPRNAALAGAASDGGTIGAVPYATPEPTLPGYDGWCTRVLGLVPQMIAILDGIDGANWNANNHINHDGAYGAIQMRDHLPDDVALLDIYRDHYLRIYRDIYCVPNNGAVTGYLLFPEGLALSWERDGDTASRDVLIDMRTNSTWVNTDDVLNHQRFSRECTYGYLVQYEADRLGLVPWTVARVAYQVDCMLGHIDMWTGDPASWAEDPEFPDEIIQPFMMGITGIGLAKHLDYLEAEKATTDVRIVPALARLAVRMRQRLWVAADECFMYQINPDGSDYNGAGYDATVLNNEAGNFFGWLARRTGNDYFAIAGDEAWIAGYNSTEFYQPKQLNQLIRWSPLYVGWRTESPGTEGDFYVVDPPFVPSGAVGVASDPWYVVPMTDFTGTITPDDDAAGGTFTPAVLTWSGTHEPQSFTYTPAVPGVATISCTSSVTLADPAPCTYTAEGGPEPEPEPIVRILQKRSAVPGKVPTPESLVQGEIALNTADGRIFTRLEGGTVVELGATEPPDLSHLVTLDTAQTITGAKTYTSITAATTSLVVRGAAAQTANLQEWQDATGAVLSRVKADGTTAIQSAVPGHANGLTVADSVANSIQASIGRGNGVHDGVLVYYVPDLSFYIKNAYGEVGILSASFTWLRGTDAELCFQLTATGDMSLAKNTSAGNRRVAAIDRSWADATDATRKGRLALSAHDWTGPREGMRIEADGTQARLGFHGVPAVPRAAAPTTLEEVITLLRNLGLCQ